jgi:tRNA A58 N-methylase Trm61
MRWQTLVNSRLSRRLLRALGVAGPRETTFTSFRAYLPALVRYLQPLRALEFGPGTSSRIILAHSKARILSIETDERYFEKARREIQDERFDVRHVPGAFDFGSAGEQRFDLVFVDGGDRNANLLGAHSVLAPGGVVVLHDAHREDYALGVRSYGYGYFIENHSLLLCNERARFESLRARFAADTSCRCKYCGTTARAAYRKELGAELGPG